MNRHTYPIRRSTIKNILASLIIISSIISIQATDIVFTGAISSAWNNPSNWSPAQVPSFGDTVHIGNETVEIIGNFTARAYSISIESAGSLAISAASRLDIRGDGTLIGLDVKGSCSVLGELTITNTSYGIYANGALLNQGSILILDTQSSGIQNDTLGVITNFGSITVDESELYGIESAGSINNLGSIEILETDSYGVSFTGYFLGNQECADLVSNNGVSLSSESILINNGMIRTVKAKFDFPGILIENNGFLVDYSGESGALSSITNNGFYYQNMFSPVGIGDEIEDFITSGSTSLIISDSVYTDFELSTSGGFFDLTSGSWAISENALGLDTFYMEYQTGGTCIDTITLLFSSKILSCNVVNEFLGTTSSYWNDPTNWSLGHVPLSCEEIILDGETVIIEDGVSAVTTTIICEGTGDSILVESGGLLTIRHGNYGIKAGGNTVIQNEGSIQIDSIVKTGIFPSTDQLEVLNSGSLQIQDIGEYGIGGDESSTYIENNGTISISKVQISAISITGSLLNNDSLIISESYSVAIYLEADTSYNYGDIIISNSSNGIDLHGDFINESNISMDGIDGSYGLKINAATFFGTPSKFTNYGELSLEGSAVLGIDISDELLNYGDIKIHDFAAVAIFNQLVVDIFPFKANIKSSVSSCSFQNHGTLELTGNPLYSIENRSEMYNDTCGIISYSSQLEMSQEIHNYGYIQDNSLDTAIISGEQTFYNYGILHSLNNSFNAYIGTVNFDNSGFYLNDSLAGTFQMDSTSDAVFDYLESAISLGTTWYTDEALTESAGTYNGTDNTWTPSRAAVGSTTFFSEVSGLNQECSFAVPIILETAVVAPNCDSINFEMTTNGFWSRDENWDLNRVPQDCDDVVVPSGLSIGITTTDSTFCNTIQVEIGGQISISVGGLFEVQK